MQPLFGDQPPGQTHRNASQFQASQTYSQKEPLIGTRFPGKPSRTIYVGGLPYHYNEGDVQILIGRFSNPIRIRILRNRKSRSRGFGYIDFSSTTDAARALEFLNGRVIGDRELRAEFAEETDNVVAARLGAGGPVFPAHQTALNIATPMPETSVPSQPSFSPFPPVGPVLTHNSSSFTPLTADAFTAFSRFL